jgi:A/G-specific adenine glycosylase
VKKRKDFQELILRYYHEHGRHDLPWRLPEGDGTFDPYKILVSEIMLQQTQVPRVIPKYTAFLAQFPTTSSIATASLGMVLKAWQGLGYNRRAKFLWQAAQMIEQEYGGALPHGQAALERLPGVGKNTAGAIRAYAFNEPAVFIETNIRTAYIHYFFKDQLQVTDTLIRQLVESTLDRQQSRIWYWALMDYGSYLKSTVGNVSRVSKSYAKQSRFQGSVRQLRGRVLKLLAGGQVGKADLLLQLGDERSEAVLAHLIQEGLVCESNGGYSLP